MSSVFQLNQLSILAQSARLEVNSLTEVTGLQVMSWLAVVNLPKGLLHTALHCIALHTSAPYEANCAGENCLTRGGGSKRPVFNKASTLNFPLTRVTPLVQT